MPTRFFINDSTDIDTLVIPDHITHLYIEKYSGIREITFKLPPNLVALTAFDCKLERLPEDLPDTLEEIHATSNLLSELPARLPARLPANLVALYVGGNQLSEIKPELLRSLTELDISYNRFAELPEIHDRFVGLYMKGNLFKPRLSDLPPTIQLLDTDIEPDSE